MEEHRFVLLGWEPFNKMKTELTIILLFPIEGTYAISSDLDFYARDGIQTSWWMTNTNTINSILDLLQTKLDTANRTSCIKAIIALIESTECKFLLAAQHTHLNAMNERNWTWWHGWTYDELAKQQITELDPTSTEFVD